MRKSSLGRACITAALCAAAGMALIGIGPASGKTCTPQDAEKADEMVDQMDSWAKVSVAYAKYGHCDDGEIAEGNSEAVARLLVDHWKTLPQLDALIKRNPQLKGFVLRHVDATLDTKDLGSIQTLSASSCPSGLSPLCQDLSAAAAKSAAQ
ncbi:hypothetical protein FBZ89_12176 [Nitrospirillum amazonense]|uniref:Uncharacterized protein n=1 Tax=Nitrospirillum amazonense TaxID=28077 RepID=A0A560EUR1_9PROT|nr:hypothetical protein [Nitrospirillum amazonense]TWB13109.1 hypothetical protein FBZ89_12176 [Nitrospirillum amazonense]